MFACQYWSQPQRLAINRPQPSRKPVAVRRNGDRSLPFRSDRHLISITRKLHPRSVRIQRRQRIPVEMELDQPATRRLEYRIELRHDLALLRVEITQSDIEALNGVAGEITDQRQASQHISLRTKKRHVHARSLSRR